MKLILSWIIVLSTAPLLRADAKKTSGTHHYTVPTTVTNHVGHHHSSGGAPAVPTNAPKQEQHELGKIESTGSSSRGGTSHAASTRASMKSDQAHTKVSEFNYRNDKGAVKTEKNIPRARIDRVQKKP